MRQGQPLLAAGLIAFALSSSAWADSATAPPKQPPKAAPAKAAPKAAPAAPARVAAPARIAATPAAAASQPEPKTLLGVRLGSPGGLDAYVMHAVSPEWAIGFSVGGFPLSVEGDKINLFGAAAEARYHWSGLAPKSGYLFGQLAYLNGKFNHKDGEIEREDANGLYPYVGIGYQTRTTGASWDMGIGAGRPVKIKRKTSNQDDELNVELCAYLGIGMWLP
jgi:hypothetical protein